MKIFLDVDGVLLRGFHANPELRKLWYENLYKDLGIKKEDFDKHVFNSNWIDVMEGRRELESLLEEALQAFDYKGTVQDVKNYWFQEDSNVDQEFIGLLQDIKRKNNNVQFYLATDQERSRADYLWNDLKFKDIFEDIFYSAKIGMVKRNPDFFHTVNKQLGFKDCKDVLFFDDHLSNVESARSAGWNAFEYKTIKDFVENPLIKELMV